MLNATLKRLDFHFDKANNAIVFSGETQEGGGFTVSFPIAHVSAVFDEEAAQVGYTNVLLGEYGATLDGFHRHMNHARSRGYGHLYDRALHRVRNHAAHYGLTGIDYVNDWQENELAPELGSLWSSFKKFTLAPITLPVQAAKVVARSKTAGTILGGVAIAFPAVGAPALAAWGAAHTAMAMYDAHQRGRPSHFPQLHANITRMAQDDSLESRTTMAALASVHPDINAVIAQAQAFLDAARDFQAQGGLTASVNMGGPYVAIGAPYIAPPSGHTTALARLAPAAPTGAHGYVAHPAGRAYVAPPAGRSYIAPPTGRYGAPASYIAPPTGRYIAPPTGRYVAQPFGRSYIAPPTGRYIAPPTGRYYPGFGQYQQPRSFIAPSMPDWAIRDELRQDVIQNRAQLAPPPPGYFRDLQGALRPISSVNATEPWDATMPYGPEHHRGHRYQHEPAFDRGRWEREHREYHPQPAQTFHQGYYQ